MSYEHESSESDGDNMLNEDKIKLMTGIAMFEKKEGRRIFPINRFFQGDYISRHLFQSFFSYTICYFLCMVVWVVYNVEKILNAMTVEEIIATGQDMAFFYAAGLFFYLIITWFVYRRRYEYAKRGMKVYVAKLKRLEKRYEFQNRAKELSKEGGRYARTSRS